MRINRSGFAPLILLFFLAVIVLKFYIVFRFASMVEEKARQDAGLPPKPSVVEAAEGWVVDHFQSLKEGSN